jgi:hypothetical protein
MQNGYLRAELPPECPLSRSHPERADNGSVNAGRPGRGLAKWAKKSPGEFSDNRGFGNDFILQAKLNFRMARHPSSNPRLVHSALGCLIPST